MSERYVVPPPPYELSIQRDQKVAEEVQTLEASKECTFRDEECKDSKYSKVLINGTLEDIPNTPKRQTRSATRPLPPRPAINIDTRPHDPRGQEGIFRSVAEIRTCAVQNDHEMESNSPAPPPFSAIGPPLGEPSYLQSMFHPTIPVHPTPSHYPSQLSHDPPRRNYYDRRPVSAGSSIEPGADAQCRHSSRVASKSTPQDRSFETRLSFDPSVAYSDSQADIRSAFSAQRGVATSLYSSAVSSHLHLDSATIPGPGRSHVSVQPTEPSDFDKADVPSVRPFTLYTPRPRSSSGYEQRWAMSESDITRDVYRN